MPPQCLTVITPGMSNIAYSSSFYEALGFRPAEFDSPDVLFFDMNGVVRGLYGHGVLAEDATVEPQGQVLEASLRLSTLRTNKPLMTLWHSLRTSVLRLKSLRRRYSRVVILNTSQILTDTYGETLEIGTLSTIKMEEGRGLLRPQRDNNDGS